MLLVNKTKVCGQRVEHPVLDLTLLCWYPLTLEERMWLICAHPASRALLKSCTDVHFGMYSGMYNLHIVALWWNMLGLGLFSSRYNSVLSTIWGRSTYGHQASTNLWPHVHLDIVRYIQCTTCLETLKEFWDLFFFKAKLYNIHSCTLTATCYEAHVKETGSMWSHDDKPLIQHFTCPTSRHYE